MTTHVELSPSSASRWLNCPGSVALSRTVPPQLSSAASEEGTLAHAFAETALRVGTTCRKIAEGGGWDRVSEEMIGYAQVFVDFCNSLMPNAERMGIEQYLTLDALNPPAPMGGTADFLCWSPERLDIVDLKYGKGVFVDAQDNPQLLYYAVMGMLWCEKEGLAVPPEVRITIVQPRIEYVGDTIRSVSYTLDDLLGFASELLNGAVKALKAVGYSTKRNNEFSAYLIVGSHCRWCPALTICPAQKAEAALVASMDFDVVTPEKLPAPVTLSSAELGSILSKATWLSQWVSALEKEVTERLGRNELVDGWQLSPKQARRKWIADERIIADHLIGAGMSEFEIYDRKVRGIGEIEKALKKYGTTLPEGITTKESSGFTLTPVSSGRPDRAAIASSEFTVISSTSE